MNRLKGRHSQCQENIRHQFIAIQSVADMRLNHIVTWLGIGLHSSINHLTRKAIRGNLSVTRLYAQYQNNQGRAHVIRRPRPDSSPSFGIAMLRGQLLSQPLSHGMFSKTATTGKMVSLVWT